MSVPETVMMTVLPFLISPTEVRVALVLELSCWLEFSVAVWRDMASLLLRLSVGVANLDTIRSIVRLMLEDILELPRIGLDLQLLLAKVWVE